jgi:precorrin isomerase
MHRFNCRHLRELEDELQAKGILAAQSTVFTHQLELLLRLTKAVDRLRQNEPISGDHEHVSRGLRRGDYDIMVAVRRAEENTLSPLAIHTTT